MRDRRTTDRAIHIRRFASLVVAKKPSPRWQNMQFLLQLLTFLLPINITVGMYAIIMSTQQYRHDGQVMLFNETSIWCWHNRYVIDVVDGWLLTPSVNFTFFLVPSSTGHRSCRAARPAKPIPEVDIAVRVPSGDKHFKRPFYCCGGR